MNPQSARSNIVWSMAAKAVTTSVAILSVPLLLTLLGTEQYGAWVTLTSLVALISLLDLGVGNSMRNSVASMSDSNGESVRNEFIGFFRILCLVGLIATVGFSLVVLWSDFFAGYSGAAYLLYAPLLLLLPLILGASVLQGARATALQSVLQASGSFGFFAFIGLLSWFSFVPSINNLAFAWSFCYLGALLVMFSLALRTLQLPPRRLVGTSVSSLPRGRLRIGLEFLILQLSSLVLYSLGNLLVFHHLGAGEVARYDILNKVFQVGLSLYTIVIGVMWSEIARSRSLGDAEALIRILRRLAAISILFSMTCLLGAFAAPVVVDIWTHHRIHVERQEALAIAGLVSAQSLSYVGAVFLNAFEQIRLQIILGIVAIVVMVPLATALFDWGVGIASVPLAALLLTFLPMIVCNVYAVRLIRGVRQAEKFVL